MHYDEIIRPIKKATIILGVLCTTYIVLAFVHILPSQMYYDYSANWQAQEHRTFGGVFRQNPYCLVDPTCLNPFTKKYTSGTNQGFALHEFNGTNTFANLARPNYVFFMAMLTLPTALITYFLRTRGQLQLVLLGVIALWCILEVQRWINELAAYSASRLGLVLEGIGTTIFSLGTLGLVWWLVRRLTYSKSQIGAKEDDSNLSLRCNP